MEIIIIKGAETWDEVPVEGSVFSEALWLAANLIAYFISWSITSEARMMGWDPYFHGYALLTFILPFVTLSPDMVNSALAQN